MRHMSSGPRRFSCLRSARPHRWEKRAFPLLLVLALAACAETSVVAPGPSPGPAPKSSNPLTEASAWVCQLQGIDRPGAVDRLARSRADLVVMEPVVSVRGREGFPIRPVVAQIRASPGVTRSRKICVAYVSVGQAETYRSYYRDDWNTPGSGDVGRGEPDFLLSPDGDGWEGNLFVAYWDPRWKALLFGSPESLVDVALDAGFDGVFLDWVLAYRTPPVRSAAEQDGVDPAEEMVRLVRDLRDYGRARRPGFVVIGLNAAGLAALHPSLFDVLDGVCEESLSFQGAPASDWDDPGSHDKPTPAVGDWSTASSAAALAPFVARGIPVFTLDYAVEPTNVEAAERTSRGFGFVPFVSRTSLSRLPDRTVGD